MLNAAIVIDDWKLSIFKKHLDKAGYTFERFLGPTPGVMTLKVQTKTKEELVPIVKAAHKECCR